MDDLLNTFLGVDGRFIRAKLKKHTEGMHMTYTLDCEMDPSIRDMARRMLPLRQALYPSCIAGRRSCEHLLRGCCEGNEG